MSSIHTREGALRERLTPPEPPRAHGPHSNSCVWGEAQGLLQLPGASFKNAARLVSSS